MIIKYIKNCLNNHAYHPSVRFMGKASFHGGFIWILGINISKDIHSRHSERVLITYIWDNKYSSSKIKIYTNEKNVLLKIIFEELLSARNVVYENIVLKMTQIIAMGASSRDRKLYRWHWVHTMLYQGTGFKNENK